MKLDLIIAIWGALLSTILAINTFLQTKKEYRINLLIDCQEIISDGKEMINVFISNTWKRPVTLIELSWGLGSDKEFQTILYSYHLQDLIKLNESESFSISFDKR